jgi:hypothetical protein
VKLKRDASAGPGTMVMVVAETTRPSTAPSIRWLERRLIVWVVFDEGATLPGAGTRRRRWVRRFEMATR